jgi:glycosyltransferase involved in cell wall biosynthesis
MMSSELPLVSIICPTYNHEKFIAQTLDGFISQKTNFPFEIIVHDDASTDNTVAIVKKYEEKYPNLFSNIFQKENQLSKAIDSVTRITFAAARGKYIAWCEGDDYWIDPNKLQKQTDFLTSKAEFVACCSNVYEEYDNVKRKITGAKTIITFKDLAFGNCIYTNSTLFKNIVSLPEWMSKCKMGDWIVMLLLTQHGSIYNFDEQMSVYRIHNNSFWSGAGSEKNLKDILITYDILIDNLPPEFTDELKMGAKQYYFKLLSTLSKKKSMDIFKWSRKAFALDHDPRHIKYILKFIKNRLAS